MASLQGNQGFFMGLEDKCKEEPASSPSQSGSHSHSHTDSHSGAEGGPVMGHVPDAPFFVGQGQSFPEVEGLPVFETAEFEALLGDALGPLDDADLIFDDGTPILEDPAFEPRTNGGTGVPAVGSQGASGETTSGASADPPIGESADTSAGKSAGETGSPTSSFSSSSNLFVAPSDLPRSAPSALVSPFATNIASPGSNDGMAWEARRSQGLLNQIDANASGHGLTSPGLSELMPWAWSTPDTNRPNRLTCDAISGFVWENSAPQGSQLGDRGSPEAAGVSADGGSAGSGHQLVLASCPPGCKCDACEMGLFDWVVPEGKPDLRSGSFQARRDSLASGESSLPPLGAAGSDRMDAGLTSPGRKRQQLSRQGWEGSPLGAGSSPGDILPRVFSGTTSGQQPVAITGGSLRRGGTEEEEAQGRSGSAGGGEGHALVVARPGRGRVDMTNRLAGVIKEIRHKQTGAELLEMVVTSDRKQNSSLFRRSRVEELEVAPLAQAFLDANLQRTARGGGTGKGASAGGGLGVPGGSVPPVRQRRSRAKPAADGTMRPRAPPAIQVEPSGLRYVARGLALPEDSPLMASEISLEEVQQQLLQLAEATAAREEAQVKRLTRQLAIHANDRGSAAQRVAHYFLDALKARADGTGAQRYNMAAQVPAQEMSEAMEQCFSVLPHVDFMHMSSMSPILACVKDPPGGRPFKRVHILSLGIWMGRQWVHLIQQLAFMPGGPPALHVTGIDISTGNELSESKASAMFVGRLLSKVAAQFGVSFTFTGMGATMTSFRPSLFEVQEGEALFVTSNIGCLFFPDDSVIRWNPRDTCLRWIRDLRPLVLVINELDADLNTNFFVPRFREALQWFSTVFDSLDACLPRASPHRHNCERLYFARDIINVVACEGLARTVRAERLESWQRRLERLGFLRMPLSDATVRAVQGVVRKGNEILAKKASPAEALEMLSKMSTPAPAARTQRSPSVSASETSLGSGAAAGSGLGSSSGASWGAASSPSSHGVPLASQGSHGARGGVPLSASPGSAPGSGAWSGAASGLDAGASWGVSNSSPGATQEGLGMQGGGVPFTAASFTAEQASMLAEFAAAAGFEVPSGAAEGGAGEGAAFSLAREAASFMQAAMPAANSPGMPNPVPGTPSPSAAPPPGMPSLGMPPATPSSLLQPGGGLPVAGIPGGVPGVALGEDMAALLGGLGVEGLPLPSEKDLMAEMSSLQDLLGGISPEGMGQAGFDAVGGGSQDNGLPNGVKLPAHLGRMAQCVLGQMKQGVPQTEPESRKRPRGVQGSGPTRPKDHHDVVEYEGGLRLTWKGHLVLSTSAWRSYA